MLDKMKFKKTWGIDTCHEGKEIPICATYMPGMSLILLFMKAAVNLKAFEFS